MKLKRPSRSRLASGHRGFTLIELLIVVGIMAMICAVTVPMVVRGFQKQVMRLAVSQIQEACFNARRQAVLQAVPTALHIRPLEKQFDVVSVGGASVDAGMVGGATLLPEEGEENPRPAAAGGFSAKLPDTVEIGAFRINASLDLEKADDAYCIFYPNGTSDEMQIALVSAEGEIRELSLDPVTGGLEVEIKR